MSSTAPDPTDPRPADPHPTDHSLALLTVSPVIPVVVIDEGPLVLVETRKDLSQVRMPFDPPNA